MFDSFLKIDGIDGECEDDKHKKWIQLLSFNHQITHRGTNLGGGGSRGSSGKAEHGDFKFTKYVDIATPKLNLRCIDGNNLKKVTIEICRTVGEKKAYLTYTFEPCLVSSVVVGGRHNDENERPIEEVTFNYTKIEWSYQEIKKDNTPGGSSMAHWDLSADQGG